VLCQFAAQAVSHNQDKVSKLSAESKKTPTAENIKHNSSA
jgi:hypothetical protein